jgi:integrase/recombinase XerC
VAELPAIAARSGPLAVPALDLYSAVLAGRKASTVRAYTADYADFGRFVDRSPADALDGLISLEASLAFAVVHSYRTHLLERKLSPATICRRLAALRSAVKLAAHLGRVRWSLEVESPRVESYRDTSGPGDEGYRRLRTAAEQRDGAQGRRDTAIVRLLHDLALRRNEVCGLDLADVELDRCRIWIVGKGHTERSSCTVPPRAMAALVAWIQVRGDWPGPLFTRLDRASTSRLSGESIRLIIAGLSDEANLARRARPHGLRHQAITCALDKSGGNVRAVQRLSRHKNLNTLTKYDDNLRDLGGHLSELISED